MQVLANVAAPFDKVLARSDMQPMRMCDLAEVVVVCAPALLLCCTLPVVVALAVCNAVLCLLLTKAAPDIISCWPLKGCGCIFELFLSCSGSEPP